MLNLKKLRNYEKFAGCGSLILSPLKIVAGSFSTEKSLRKTLRAMSSCPESLLRPMEVYKITQKLISDSLYRFFFLSFRQVIVFLRFNRLYLHL